MTSSPTRPTQLHVTAEIVIDAPPDAAPLSQTTPTGSLVVSGQVIQARTGTALQGQRVVAFVDGGSLGVSTPLGTAISDADGRFQIQFDK